MSEEILLLGGQSRCEIAILSKIQRSDKSIYPSREIERHIGDGREDDSEGTVGSGLIVEGFAIEVLLVIEGRVIEITVVVFVPVVIARDAGDPLCLIGVVIAPGQKRRDHLFSLGVTSDQRVYLLDDLPGESSILEGGEEFDRLVRFDAGALDVEHDHRLLGPLRPGFGDLLIGAGRPVVAGVGGPPFLGGMQDKSDRVLEGPVRALQRFSDGENQAHASGIVLESREIRIVVGGDDDQLIVLSRDVAKDVIGGNLQIHARVDIESDLDLIGLSGLHHCADPVEVIHRDGKYGCVLGTADIVGGQRIRRRLPESSGVGDNQSVRSLQLSLQGRIIDPPVPVLVDGG